jgi:NADPH2:quinone reductase
VKSVIYSETGEPSVLRLVERPIPEPGPGEVRVRVVVSGVNPTDWKSRKGAAPGQPAAHPEVTPNLDGAGVVDAVGADVAHVVPGDRVWVIMAAATAPSGTAQEFTVLPAWSVVPLPDAASFEVGASLGVPAITAHRALTVAENGPARLAPDALKGRTVLVSGGAGAVGHAAIQLARWAGATVITTVSGPEKAELTRRAGAHHVLNYRDGDTAAAVRRIAPEGVDVVVEVALGANLGLDLDVIRHRATIACYANDGGVAVALPVLPSMVANVRLQFVLLYTVGEDYLADATEDITAALRDGALPVGEEHGLPLLRFPLAETAEAHAAVEAGAVGKVIIDVARS